MNKLRVIDLLNKIANGEKTKSIDYKRESSLTYYLYDKCGSECDDTNLVNILNEEIEIIGEDKKIENIGVIHFNETPTEAILHRKIEEIIDYINKEDK